LLKFLEKIRKMNDLLLPIFYLPNISWFSKFLKEDYNVFFEKWENFPKQTYRNRTYIYGANGKLPLIIPIKHTGDRLYKNLKISYSENWQKLHWKSIKIAYQSSPFFEFYENDLQKIYLYDIENLMEFNLNSLEIVFNILKCKKKIYFTDKYDKGITKMKDYRDFFSTKKQYNEIKIKEYYQVFSDKLGFFADLSIVDLICNLGPESLGYIKEHSNLF